MFQHDFRDSSIIFRQDIKIACFCIFPDAMKMLLGRLTHLTVHLFSHCLLTPPKVQAHIFQKSWSVGRAVNGIPWPIPLRILRISFCKSYRSFF